MAEQKPRDDYLRMAFHLGLEQLQSSRPPELLGYALYWSRLAVDQAKQYVCEVGDPRTAQAEKMSDRPTPEQQRHEGIFLCKNASHPDLILVISYCVRFAVLDLAGHSLHALEAARLALDSATRAKDHKLIARLTRLVSDVEEEIAEEEAQEEVEGEADI